MRTDRWPFGPCYLDVVGVDPDKDVLDGVGRPIGGDGENFAPRTGDPAFVIQRPHAIQICRPRAQFVVGKNGTVAEGRKEGTNADCRGRRFATVPDVIGSCDSSRLVDTQARGILD